MFIRTRMLFCDEGMERLGDARAAVFGIGGVGGYVFEALVRSGIGTIDIFDDDTVAPSNLNRQIIATTSAIGRAKVDVARERALSINPDVVINAHRCFYMPDTADGFDLSVYDYIADAIDTVSGKLEIITRAEAAGVPVISSMGTGNKLNAAMLEIADIYDTSVCPLARVMRHELRRRGIEKLKVVYSKEEPIVPRQLAESGHCAPERGGTCRRSTPGSVAFVPAVAGLLMAGEIVKDIVYKDC